MTDRFERERRTILIGGAGIAGLAAALFIARAGFRVEIFEQAKKLDPIGSGIQLSPNALHVLDQLNLDRLVKSNACAPLSIETFNGISGKKLIEIPLGREITEEYGQPYLTIHRADLQSILFQACEGEPDIQIRLGTRIEDAVSHPNGVTIIANDGRETGNFRGIGLIGADGVNSIIRNECLDTQPIIPTGTMALRALSHESQLPDFLKTTTVKMWLAPEAHAVAYPVRGGNHHNFVITVPDDFTANCGLNADLDEKLTGSHIAIGLAKWKSEFRDLLDIDLEWTPWPLNAAPKLKSWHERNIGIIGDAAHAMTPHAAQGAAMALEDASVLGWALEQTGSLETAFPLLEEERLNRVNEVAKISLKNKAIFHMPKELAIFRNLGMQILGGERIFARQGWIYSWTPPSRSS